MTIGDFSSGQKKRDDKGGPRRETDSPGKTLDISFRLRQGRGVVIRRKETGGEMHFSTSGSKNRPK